MAVSALSLISEKLSLSNKLRSIAQCHQGTVFPCWSFSSLRPSDYLIPSLLLSISFFFFSTPALSRLHFFATPSRPALCLHLLSCHLSFCDLFIAFFFPASYPLLPHTQRPETPRCTLSMVALWKVNNSVSVPAATAASSSVWLRRVSAAITQFNLLPRASRLQVASFSPKTSLSFFYTKRNRVWPRGALK